jgi:cytochrome c553
MDGQSGDMFRKHSMRRAWIAAATTLLVVWSVASHAEVEDFDSKLARVDQALQSNPNNVNLLALNSCLRQRNFAARLYDSNHIARAHRSLDFCFQVLHISAEPPVARPVDASKDMAGIQAMAAKELETALSLKPDLDNGLAIYRSCAACHQPEGWGLLSGLVPQIAGQHRTVVIKQLADIRAGNRDAILMLPYATVEAIGGVQAVADVAGYIDTLEIFPAGGKGPGDQLELGERLYREKCVACHGERGEGNAEAFVPRIQAQHYRYLVKQFEQIRNGTRLNANPEMQAQIAAFDDAQMHAVLDYVSRLEPPEEMQAPPGWLNPDFAR